VVLIKGQFIIHTIIGDVFVVMVIVIIIAE